MSWMTSAISRAALISGTSSMAPWTMIGPAMPLTAWTTVEPCL